MGSNTSASNSLPQPQSPAEETDVADIDDEGRQDMHQIFHSTYKKKLVIASKNVFSCSSNKADPSPLQVLAPLQINKSKSTSSMTKSTSTASMNKGIAPVLQVQNVISTQIIKKIVEAVEKPRKRTPFFAPIVIDPAKFTRLKQTSILNDYTFIENIGEGSYGKVYKAVKKIGQDVRAIKKLSKEKVSEKDKADLLNQLNLLKRLDHPNIIKLYDMYEDEDNYYVVTELCEGGCLLDFVNSYNLSQAVLKGITSQILSAIHYLHNLKILHRDIKLENVVLVKKADNYLYQLPEIKVIDFGASVHLDSYNQDDDSISGTLLYMPPEALTGKLTLSWDVWSLGILLFIMATGKLPYKFNSTQELVTYILNSSIQWKNAKKMTRQVRYFLNLCLVKDWRMRVDANTLLKHPWIKQTKKLPLTQSKRQSTIANLVSFKNKNNFVSFIESYLSSKKIKQIQRQKLAGIFTSIDTDKDGLICKEQLRRFCLDYGRFKYEDEIECIFEKVDKNRSNKIQFSQFITMMQERDKLFDKQSLQEAFQFFDETKSGAISKTEMKNVLGGIENDEVDYLFKQLDSDGDDIISKEEFIEYLINN